MKIVILGNSAAGAKIIEEIRKSDSTSEIVIIAFDGHYPNARDAYAAFIAKEIAPEKVFTRSKNFYEQHNVTILVDKKITRINVKRKKIFTEDADPIDYDVMIVTDTPENRFPDLKGVTKQNIFGYKKLKDVDAMVNALPVVKTVVIQSDSFSGLQAAASFIKREKEVILVSSEENFFTKHFENETLGWLLPKLEEKGLRVMAGNPIVEILGDKDAKAVRLRSGKVFSAEIILFMEMEEDLRLFSGSGIQTGKKIDVDKNFKAIGADDVFVVDQSCSYGDTEPITPFLLLEAQGKKVAAVLSGQEYELISPIRSQSFQLDGMAMTALGKAQEGGDVTVKHVFDPASCRYQGLYIENNCLVGAVLINSDDQKEELLRQINEKRITASGDDAPQIASETVGEQCCAADIGSENVSTEHVDN